MMPKMNEKRSGNIDRDHVGKVTESDIISTSFYFSVLNLGVITPTKTTIDGKKPLKYKLYIGANKTPLQVSGFSCEQKSFLLPSNGDHFVGWLHEDT